MDKFAGARFAQRPGIWLLISALLTAGVYWQGLHGPFLFDDSQTFSAVRRWMQGTGSLTEVLAGNTSWVTHRSLAMASFALNAALFGYDPFYFKAVNLALHLVMGACIYAVLGRLLKRDATLERHAKAIAFAIAAVWLLHPLHVTTVLYAVQRMAQLAALACLLGVWAYVSLRNRMEAGDNRHAWPTLFIGIPVILLLGLQAKQNAVVLPGLCLAIEFAYYRAPRPGPVKAFFAVFLAIPAFLVVAGLLIEPNFLLDDYIMYEFSLWQRLLSEARVFCDYIGQLIAPHTPSMGVFTDDYRPSYGLFDPPSTAACIALLGIATAVAVRFRRTMPSLFAGWFFFLVAHSVEGSILPIELYYEHRNYLPSIGIFLACATLVFAIGQLLAKRGIRAGRVGPVCLGALLLTFALQTHGRTRVWSDPLLLFSSEFRHHPESIRAIINYVGVASEVGDLSRAYKVANERVHHAVIPRVRGQTMLFRITLDCTFGRVSTTADLNWAVSQINDYVDMTSYHLIDRIAEQVVRGNCNGIDSASVAHAFRKLGDQAVSQPDNSLVKTGIRNRAALLYAGAGQWKLALQQATLGWQPRAPDPDAALFIQALLVSGDVDRADAVLREALSRPGLREDDARDLELIRPFIAAERRTPGWYRQRVAKPDASNAGKAIPRRR